MTTQISVLNRNQARIENAFNAAVQELQELQTQLSQEMEDGVALSVGTVERIFLQEQVLRNWRQVLQVGMKASTEAQLKTSLQEWLRDAIEQVMGVGRSGSTSLIRTAQLHAEEDGIKTVARIVERIIDGITL
jgi:hypothetical protein